ncbi:MAG: bifunctional tetrahydrofolate synthase/dihydrofolate synthase [Gammaproteobacteria bacterium]|nr:bifunctional tetrahydrofolate synthase/dihydrofolate synthase [Gammaproteobacteria bacterium]
MRFNTLQEWLDWQEALHHSEIELGLDRVRPVLSALQADARPFHLITVGGTNGKGSSVAMLEAIYLAAGYRVGCYTSPHLLRYNERIRLNGEEIADSELMAAFDRVDQARAQTSITYFEFGTLAAIDLFYRQRPDVVIMEVGMGGRLDAVNLLDADLALVTNVALDHTAWLGEDREAIGYEKAGIFRSGRPAIFNERDVPRRLVQVAEEIGANLYRLGREFDYQVQAHEWSLKGPDSVISGLPRPALKGEIQIRNAAGVLMAVSCLQSSLPVSPAQMRQGLLQVSVAGRMQLLPGSCPILVDVAHNPHAAATLAASLRERSVVGRTLAVVAMLADKDISGVLAELCAGIDVWFVAGLDVPRGTTADDLAERVSQTCPGAGVSRFDSVTEAYREAIESAGPEDRLLVFGSFYTVAEVLKQTV